MDKFKHIWKGSETISGNELAQPSPLEEENIQFIKSEILVVDDIPINIEVIKEFLIEHNEIKISEATTSQMALSILENLTPDLMIIDLILPDINGMELTKKIKEIERLKQIPIICFTASALRRASIVDADLFDSIMYKPIKKQELIQNVKKFIEYKVL